MYEYTYVYRILLILQSNSFPYHSGLLLQQLIRSSTFAVASPFKQDDYICTHSLNNKLTLDI